MNNCTLLQHFNKIKVISYDDNDDNNIILGHLKEQCMANNMHPKSLQSIWEFRRKEI